MVMNTKSVKYNARSKDSFGVRTRREELAPKMRWHDKNPMLAEAVKSWEHFSPMMRRVVAQCVLDYSRENRLVNKYNLIRPNKVVSLCFSWRRQRWYDQDTKVRRAFNTLILWDYHDVMVIARRILYVELYFQNLKDRDKPMPTDHELPNLVSYLFNNPHKFYS